MIDLTSILEDIFFLQISVEDALFDASDLSVTRELCHVQTALNRAAVSLQKALKLSGDSAERS